MTYSCKGFESIEYIVDTETNIIIWQKLSRKAAEKFSCIGNAASTSRSVINSTRELNAKNWSFFYYARHYHAKDTKRTFTDSYASHIQGEIT